MKKTIKILKVFYSLSKEFLVLLVFSVVIFLLMGYIDHRTNQNLLTLLLVLFSMAKVYVLISMTLKRLDRMEEGVAIPIFRQVLLHSTIIIVLINLSFTLDYLCVSKIYEESFSGLNLNQPFIFRFFDLLYFSVVTFTTVGYGDIFPVGKAVKFLTILEMSTAFIIIVFVISRYTIKRNH